MFFTFGSTIVRNGASTFSDPCISDEDYSTIVGNGSWDNAHTSNPSSRGERLGGEPNTLVKRAQHTSWSSDGSVGRVTTNVVGWG